MRFDIECLNPPLQRVVFFRFGVSQGGFCYKCYRWDSTLNA
ncbi:hypothetical protein MC7420_6499 [Coleofasciculus chthonoplastes PCC 7420]|uniref:Uncharacterized protein n=1 Tax=Coleofasciculus chthonoplastes PCC 7420 TaxID=118168 RepID=B4VQJ7_9CYAN|nr:hypothetical protein MC7420_6499 [Coleofasciculus chthonoplastes PCC 7420]